MSDDASDTKTGEKSTDHKAVPGLPPGLVAGALLSVPIAVVLFGAFLLVRSAVEVEAPEQPSASVGSTVISDAKTSVSVASPDESSSIALPDVTPATPWLPVTDQQVLTRIGIGSCLSQRHPQPIWNGVLGLEKRPDLFLMIGDNVYGDIKSPDGRELVEAYRTQGSQPEFAQARAALPMLATWDDHDYGRNDGGGDFGKKAMAGSLFQDFWQIETGRPADEGIYYARIIGPEGRRVQLIFLDTRSFRGPLTRKTASFPHWGRYEPSSAPTQVMLGDAQWAWFEGELKKPAEIRVIVSSVQVLAEGHGFERWGNLPAERERLMRVLNATGAKGVIFVSGDRHAGALYAQDLSELASDGDPSTDATDQIIPELTTSSLNRSYGPSKDAPHPTRLSPILHQENFGLIDVNWWSVRE
ncbi:MAG: alkaline phosphatase D family protein [Pseudomonadota bacterium]